MRALRAMADHVVYQSEFCRDTAAKFLGPCGLPSEILYNPVDLEKFHPAECGTRTPQLRLLAAGTHGTRERVTSALGALRELRRGGIEAVLTVAGRFQWSQGEKDFADETARLGVQNAVRRLERFSQSEAPALYRSHDLLLHPKYMDPCPTVVLEAMACGLPVVGSRSGGLPEIVPADCGVLIDAQQDWDRHHTPSGSGLAAAVARIHPDLHGFSLAARRNAETRFAVGKWMEAHERIFQGLAGA
jgi:glycosyltransferase involved in cell wall biosynthesis